MEYIPGATAEFRSRLSVPCSSKGRRRQADVALHRMLQSAAPLRCGRREGPAKFTCSGGRALAHRMPSLGDAYRPSALRSSMNPNRAEPTYPSTRACWRHAPSFLSEIGFPAWVRRRWPPCVTELQSKLSADIAAFVAQKRARAATPTWSPPRSSAGSTGWLPGAFPDDETVTRACDAWLSLVADRARTS